jgi:hypothetical protein
LRDFLRSSKLLLGETIAQAKKKLMKLLKLVRKPQFTKVLQVFLPRRRNFNFERGKPSINITVIERPIGQLVGFDAKYIFGDSNGTLFQIYNANPC